MSIEFKENAVCYADSLQYKIINDKCYYYSGADKDWCQSAHGIDFIINRPSFQLNEPRIGDYIEKSELDTEQKYNDAVEVFGLFGAKGGFTAGDYERLELLDGGIYEALVFHDVEGSMCLGVARIDRNYLHQRKLTYGQLMAIGKLKRLMNEHAINRAVKSTINTELDKPIDNVKSPSHYQLIEGVESIEIIARSMTQEQWKGFCLGNMLKYRIRAGKKDALQQDIDKANFYGELYEMHKGKCYE